MWPAYKVRKELSRIGIDVQRVELTSLELTRNCVYKVWIEGQPRILKIYRDDPFGHYSINHDQLIEMHRIIKFLSQHFDYVVAPLGDLFHTPLGWATIFPLIENWKPLGDIRSLNNEQLETFGKELGKLYTFTSTIDTPLQDSTELFFQPLPQFLRMVINHNGQNLNMSRTTLVSFKEAATELLEEMKEYKTSIIHGDLHPLHYTLDETGKIMAMIDWDSMRVDIPITDLLGIVRYLNKDQAVSFFQGIFTELEPLPPDDFETILKARNLRTVFYLTHSGIIEEETFQPMPHWGNTTIESYREHIQSTTESRNHQ